MARGDTESGPDRESEESSLDLVVEVRGDGVEAGVGAVRLALPVRPLALARRGALREGGRAAVNPLNQCWGAIQR